MRHSLLDGHQLVWDEQWPPRVTWTAHLGRILILSGPRLLGHESYTLDSWLIAHLQTVCAHYKGLQRIQLLINGIALQV